MKQKEKNVRKEIYFFSLIVISKKWSKMKKKLGRRNEDCSLENKKAKDPELSKIVLKFKEHSSRLPKIMDKAIKDWVPEYWIKRQIVKRTFFSFLEKNLRE